MDQRIEKVEAETNGHGQSKDGLSHRIRPLDPAQGLSVNAGQRENSNAKKHQSKIQHQSLQVEGLVTRAGDRKHSMRKTGGRIRD